MDDLNQTQVRGDGATQHIRLACQACQRKKIKCDRTFPCGQCLRSSLTCEASTRKARVRHGGKRAVDSELRNRITKLENLVENLSGEVGMLDKDHPAQPSTPEPSSVPTSPAVGSSPFWSTLTNEVQALRDALEEDSSDDEAISVLPGGPASSETGTEHDYHDLIICPPGSVFVVPGVLPEPSPTMAKELYRIFLANVDPVWKVLHRPTVEPFLYNGTQYLGLPADSPPNRALKAAMWFAAITTLREEECSARFGMARSDLLRQYRRHCDVALTYADLIISTEMATLQACVVYVAASRITDSSRRPWTMTGLVMRLAQGMNLHHEDTSHTPYEKEMRRRLWHQIRVLDAFAASDRGSEVLIPLTSFTTQLPSNVNDEDFNETSALIPNREKGMSDMAFNLMAHLATTLTLRLLTPEHTPKGESWQQRLDLARGLRSELHEKYLQFCDLSKPFDRFIHVVGTSMAASSMLRAVRPLQKHVSSTPPKVDNPMVLELAIDSLRASEATYDDPEAAKWRWIVWVQWHALAVALAGLCSIRDTPLANTAWIFVDKAFVRHSQQVADSRNGKLWRPIEKLYRKANDFRLGIVTTTAHAHKRSISAPETQPEIRLSSLSIDGAGPSTMAGPSRIAQASLAPLAMPNLSTATMDSRWPEMPSQGAADLSWMDWENIMEEISMVPDGMDFEEVKAPMLPTDMALNDINAPAEPGGAWSYPFNQSMM